MCVSGRHFLLETYPPRRAQADGELLDMTPLEVTVRPNAARAADPEAQRSAQLLMICRQLRQMSLHFTQCTSVEPQRSQLRLG